MTDADPRFFPVKGGGSDPVKKIFTLHSFFPAQRIKQRKKPTKFSNSFFWRGNLYLVTPAVTRDLGFPGLIRKTASFSCLLRQRDGIMLRMRPMPCQCVKKGLNDTDDIDLPAKNPEY